MFKHDEGSLRKMNESKPSQIYSDEVYHAHKDGDIFIHNFEDTGKGYSTGWSIEEIGEKTKPKNLADLFNSILDNIRLLSDEWVGSQAYNNLDLATVNYSDQKKEIYDRFLSSINRRTAFSINTDEGSSDTFHDYLLKKKKKGYIQGNFNTIPIVSIKNGTSWDSEILRKYISSSFKYGNIHFQNYLTGTITYDQLTQKPKETDLSNVYLRQGGIVGNSDERGILGIITINLPRLGYLSKSEDEFFESLDQVLDLAFVASEQKRDYMETRLEDGSLKRTAEYLDSFIWHFSVINLSGMNEALLYAIEAGTAHIAGKAVTYKLLERILRKLEEQQQKSGNLYSLEALPSEEAGSVLAEKDRLKHPGMFNNDPIFYTDSTNLPPDHGDDLWDWLEHQKKYHSIYTGGAIFQVNLVEMINFRPECVTLVRKMLEEFGYNYLKISPEFSICNDHGYLRGHQEVCGVCGKSVDTYTWIDGFIRPVKSLNKVLKEAHEKRVHHIIKSN